MISRQGIRGSGRQGVRRHELRPTWAQHRVMRRRSGAGMSGSVLGRSP